jgi:hypothetical protein
MMGGLENEKMRRSSSVRWHRTRAVTELMTGVGEEGGANRVRGEGGMQGEAQ